MKPARGTVIDCLAVLGLGAVWLSLYAVDWRLGTGFVGVAFLFTALAAHFYGKAKR